MTPHTFGRRVALVLVFSLASAGTFHGQTSGSGISLALAERLGGQGVRSIAPDGQGNYWIVGYATFNPIPVTPDAAQPALNGPDPDDAYLMKLRADGSIAYASYLGGSGGEIGLGVACDSAGNVYVVGQTSSADFPVTPGAYSTTGNGFLTKFAPDGRSILYSTRIPGTGSGDFQSAAVGADSSGRAYVTGWTPSHDVPTTETNSATGQVVYMRFSPGGSLEYSTRIGGSGGDVPYGIAVDGVGNAYVVGTTRSSDFTMKRALKSTYPSSSGGQGFLARFTSSGLDFSTYIGGSSTDSLYSVAVSSTGVYVAGETCSLDFPGAPRPASANGQCDSAVIAKLQLDGSAYLASELLYGSSYENASLGMAVDDDERVYLSGVTNSPDFPVTLDAQEIAPAGFSAEGFFARVSMPDVTHFHNDYVTYFAAMSPYNAVAADGAGGAWVGGWTNSDAYPTLSSSTNSAQGLIAHYAVTGAVAPASDDEVLYARDASPIVGNWQLVADSTAAGGVRIWNPDAGAPKITVPAANPATYFEMTFSAQAGVPYHLWMRMRADNDSWMNDSVWVQFSDVLDLSGAPTWQIGSTSGAMISLERCTDCGEQGWGWADDGYGQAGPLLTFATTGTHTIRVQQREDGVSIDQIVLSSRTWIGHAPGTAKNDTTIVPQTTGDQPPAVSITGPSDGDTFAAPANIFITASSSDSDGTVSKVDFYVNGTLVGTATASPYSYAWNKVTTGTYRLTAVATDNQGETTTSSPITVTVSSGKTGNLPSGWDDFDVGEPGAGGSASYANGVFTVKGAGADVWGTSDAFNFAETELSRDGSIVARVTSVSDEANWVKAGVMIRAGLADSASQAFMLVSHAKGVAFQRRTLDGGTSVSTSGSASTAPQWVKLVRSGNTISGYESEDGSNWILVGNDTFTMPISVFVGLAVSSHATGTLSTATFDNVAVTSSTSNACSSMSLSQTSFYSGGSESTWRITVTAPSDSCTWTASIDQSWLVLDGTAGPTAISGTGSGTVILQTLDNGTGAFRYGTFTIGGTTYKVTQEPF